MSEITNLNNKYGNIKSNKGKQVESNTLSKRWNIELGKSKRTVQRTIQRAVRSCINPTLSWRYPTNDRMLRYKRIPDPVFSDTIKAGTLSKIGNKYGQAYFTRYGWSRFQPMDKKSEAHDTLSLVFKQDGVPPNMIVENSREQSLGEFERNCKKADCHLVSTEPPPYWSQLAEGCIRELKRLSSRQLIKTRSPKRLWDHSIELAALIRSHNAHSNYELEGEVSEKRMTGQTTDISNICEYEW